MKKGHPNGGALESASQCRPKFKTAAIDDGTVAYRCLIAVMIAGMIISTSEMNVVASISMVNFTTALTPFMDLACCGSQNQDNTERTGGVSKAVGALCVS